MGNEAKLNADKKFEEFKKDPSAFVRKDELVIAVKQSEKGFMVFINSKSSVDELLLSQARLNRHINSAVDMKEMAALHAAKSKKLIVTPGGGRPH